MSKHRGKKKVMYKSLEQQKNELMKSKFMPGIKKSDCKTYPDLNNYIRSYGTYNSYNNIMNNFIDWLENNTNTRSIAEGKNYAAEFLAEKYGDGYKLSHQTVKTYRSCLCKCFDLDVEEVDRQMKEINRDIDLSFGQDDIVKNRGEMQYDDSKDFAREVRAVIQACGLRRSELMSLRTDSIKENQDGEIELELLNKKDSIAKYGDLSHYCNTKGGRSRTVTHTFFYKDSVAYEVLEKWIENAPESGILLEEKTIPKNQNVHQYRQTYANNLYTAIYEEKYGPVPISVIDNERIPCQRNNRSKDGLESNKTYTHHYTADGTRTFLKDVCREVSSNLGHNRQEVYNTSYYREGSVPTEYVYE